MKKIFSVVILCFFLTSCSKNYSQDAYFIHAAAFSGDDEQITMTAVCEKMQGDKSEYLVIEENGENLSSIVKAINKKYPDCYFATAEMYFFDSNISKTAMHSLAKQLCESNVFPLKGKAAELNTERIKEAFDKTKNEQDIKKLTKEHGKSSENVAVYLATETKGEKQS